jgi:anionic cell wall polymer biosynthesis LytR-Cps2A-Psr (LCP) family protein
MKYLLTALLLILSPLIIVACVIVSPIYFTYKIVERRYTFIERKQGYSDSKNKAPINDLLSFGLNMIKNSK